MTTMATKSYKTKPMSEWTEADYAADHADRMAALAALAAESERQLQAMQEQENA